MSEDTRPGPPNPLQAAGEGSHGGRSALINESPDSLKADETAEPAASTATKAHPASEQLEQVVPPSPTSNHSLDSIDNDDVSMASGLVREEALPSDGELDVIEDHDAELDTDDFYAQHIADLAAQVSLVLVDIVSKNDKTPFSPDKLTRFHSRAPPGISIRDYILRIIKFCNLDKAVLLVLLFLVDLFSDSYPNFVLNSLTVHRFLITACTVAAKGLCDQFCSNTHYAKVGGVSVMELNLLEVEFLTRVRYRIVPNRAMLPKYYARIQAKRQVIAQAKAISPSSTSGADAVRKAENPGAHAQDPDQSSTAPLTRKHSREDSQSAASASDSDSNAARPQIKSSNKVSANKGFKAMKETFRFLQPSKKKRSGSSSNA